MNRSPAWRSHSRALKDSKAIFLLVLLVPAAAHAQAVGGSPFETGFSAMQTLFTGTVAKVASLIAIVLGGYQFAHGEPGAKKTSDTAGDQSDPSEPGSTTNRRPKSAAGQSESALPGGEQVPAELRLHCPPTIERRNAVGVSLLIVLEVSDDGLFDLDQERM